MAYKRKRGYKKSGSRKKRKTYGKLKKRYAVKNAYKLSTRRFKRTIPHTMQVMMPYRVHTDIVTVATPSAPGTATGSYGEIVFQTGGLYRPHGSFAWSPKGFSEWMGLYNRYRVVGYKVFVEMVNENVSANTHGRMVVYHDSQNTDQISTTTVMEDSYIRMERKRFKPKWSNFNSPMAGRGARTVVKKSDTPHRIEAWKYESKDLEGSIAANPTITEYIHIGLLYPTRTTATTEEVRVLIQYDVLLSQTRLTELS